MLINTITFSVVNVQQVDNITEPYMEKEFRSEARKVPIQLQREPVLAWMPIINVCEL